MNQSNDPDILFSPSYWSDRGDPGEIIRKHVEFVNKKSETARKLIPCELNIAYGPTEREKMDLFGTNLPPDSPIFIYIHGGYWQMLNREQSSYVAKPFIKNGFKVIILGYSLCPQVTLLKIIKEIQTAFLKCLDYAKTQGSRGIYICGHSAGAHLVSTLLFQSFFSDIPQSDQALLKAVFLISGIYDLIPLIKTYHNGTLKLDHATAESISPLYQKFGIKSKAKVFVIVAEHESPAFIEQSRTFYKTLMELKIISEFIFVPKMDHFLIVERLNEENYELVKIIVSQK